MKKVVLVTGGGTGIGAATAGLLADAGWTVAICGRRGAVLDGVAGARSDIVPFVADLEDPEANASLVSSVVSSLGRLDALVLNAGVQHMATVAEQTLEQWNQMLAVNLTSPFLLLQAALPQLLEHRGSVVTVSSVAALRSPNAMAGYAPSKAAVLSLAQQFAVDYAPSGIRSNVVCPGWTRTELADEEMGHIAAERGTSLEESYGFVTSFVPQRRAAAANEVASVIAFLLSDAASYINAAVITVDGGHVALDPGTIPFDPRVTIEGGA